MRAAAVLALLLLAGCEEEAECVRWSERMVLTPHPLCLTMPELCFGNRLQPVLKKIQVCEEWRRRDAR